MQRCDEIISVSTGTLPVYDKHLDELRLEQ